MSAGHLFMLVRIIYNFLRILQEMCRKCYIVDVIAPVYGTIQFMGITPVHGTVQCMGISPVYGMIQFMADHPCIWDDPVYD